MGGTHLSQAKQNYSSSFFLQPLVTLNLTLATYCRRRIFIYLFAFTMAARKRKWCKLQCLVLVRQLPCRPCAELPCRSAGRQRGTRLRRRQQRRHPCWCGVTRAWLSSGGLESRTKRQRVQSVMVRPLIETRSAIRRRRLRRG